MGIRIDALNAAASATDNHEIPAMSGGETVKLTVEQISTKVQDDIADELSSKAPLASPAFTGNPTVPTPSPDDDDTSIPNTGWVQDEIAEAVAINTLTEKTTPVDADLVRIADSAAGNAAKKLTFANLWAWVRAKVLALFNASGSAPVYAARAWVNFNGTGTVAIRGSGNVSSITDNGTGDYTINYTTALENGNYLALVSTSSDSAAVSTAYINGNSTVLTTTSARIQTATSAGAAADRTYVGFAAIA